MSDPIQPSPIPVSVSLGKTPDGAIIMQFATAAGVGVYFVPSEQAKQIGAALTELATGIVVPTLASQLADSRFRP